MPVWIDRRQLVLGGLAAALGSARMGRAQTARPIRIALFSDTHIAADPADQFRGFHPHQNLQAAVQQAGSQSFDLLLVNGDLARQSGQPQDYVQFNRLIEPLLDKMPAVMTLGNHDDRKNARSALVKRSGEVQPVEKKLVTTLDAGPFHLVFLDSLMVTDIAAGQLGHSQREWLPAHLDSLHDGKPILVFVHHNPDPETDIALVDAEQLLAILRPRRAVKALFFGHTHEYRFAEQAGMHLVNLPGLGYNFADGNPVGWVQGEFTAADARLTLHALAGERSGDGTEKTLRWRA